MPQSVPNFSNVASSGIAASRSSAQILRGSQVAASIKSISGGALAVQGSATATLSDPRLAVTFRSVAALLPIPRFVPRPSGRINRGMLSIKPLGPKRMGGAEVVPRLVNRFNHRGCGQR